MLIPLIIFIFYNVKIVFKKWEIKKSFICICICFPRRPHGLQPRSDVFSEDKKVNFSDNGGFVVGTHKHFSWGYKRSLFFVVYKRSLLAGYVKN